MERKNFKFNVKHDDDDDDDAELFKFVLVGSERILFSKKFPMFVHIK